MLRMPSLVFFFAWYVDFIVTDEPPGLRTFSHRLTELNVWHVIASQAPCKIIALLAYLLNICECRIFHDCFFLIFQIFSLPNLKAVGKFKVSSRDGCRIRKAGVISFRSKSGVYTLSKLSSFYVKIA